MQAIILGAGRGTRLGRANPGVPKPLLMVRGERLLDRQLRLLQEAFPDLRNITVVVGYCAELVRSTGGPDLRYIENSNFTTTNTAASLKLALEADPDEALVLNGDVFCDIGALMELRATGSAAVCEFKSPVDPEEVQVITVGSRVQRIGKDLGGVGEAVGLYRLSSDFASQYGEVFVRGDSWRYYEDIFDRILVRYGFDFEARSLNGGVAIEIDTPDDLARVEAC